MAAGAEEAAAAAAGADEAAAFREAEEAAEVEAAAEATCRSPASQIVSPASQIMRGLFERLPFSRLAVRGRDRVRVNSLQQACAAPNPYP